MYPKNTASPRPIHAKVVNATTGAPITTGVVAYHITGATRVAVGGTAAVHVANGLWTYTPTQGETNYDQFSIEFYHADAVADGPIVEVVTDTTSASILEDTGTTLPAAIDAVPTAAEIDTQLSGTHGSGTWGSSTAGTGARAVTFTVTTGGVALHGATVRLYRTGSVDRTGTTNSSGQVTLYCDVDATWSYIVTHAIYTSGSGTVVVDGNESVSVSLTAQTFSVSDPDKVTGYWLVTKNDGTTAGAGEATVYCRLYDGPGSAGGMFGGGWRTASTNASGLAQFTNMIIGASYKVKLGANGTIFTVTVPTAATPGGTQALGEITGNQNGDLK
jgi:hypothetical protein